MSRGDALAAVVLAAGLGTRMRSALPKVLHEVAGVPMLEHVLRAVAATTPQRCVVVVGHDAVRRRFAGRAEFAAQAEQRGTADAVRAAAAMLGRWPGSLLVVNGDAVLVPGETLRRLVRVQQEGGQGMTLLSYEVDDPSGLGRIVRGGDGSVEAIVEERDADEATRAGREVNSGCYAFDAHVWEHLGRLEAGNAAGEYYLTDVVATYVRAGLPVRALQSEDEARTLMGVNDRSELARAERLMRDRIRRRWLLSGVTMHDPSSTSVDERVELDVDVVLEVGVVLRGATRVGRGARIGAYSVLQDCAVAPGGVVPPHTVARGEGLGGAPGEGPGAGTSGERGERPGG